MHVEYSVSDFLGRSWYWGQRSCTETEYLIPVLYWVQRSCTGTDDWYIPSCTGARGVVLELSIWYHLVLVRGVVLRLSISYHLVLGPEELYWNWVSGTSLVLGPEELYWNWVSGTSLVLGREELYWDWVSDTILYWSEELYQGRIKPWRGEGM